MTSSLDMNNGKHIQLDLLMCHEPMTVMPELRGPGGPLAPPQYLVDQLTLFQPGKGILSPPITTGPPPIFFTFRHHWK